MLKVPAVFKINNIIKICVKYKHWPLNQNRGPKRGTAFKLLTDLFLFQFCVTLPSHKKNFQNYFGKKMFASCCKHFFYKLLYSLFQTLYFMVVDPWVPCQLKFKINHREKKRYNRPMHTLQKLCPSAAIFGGNPKYFSQ